MGKLIVGEANCERWSISLTWASLLPTKCHDGANSRALLAPRLRILFVFVFCFFFLFCWFFLFKVLRYAREPRYDGGPRPGGALHVADRTEEEESKPEERKTSSCRGPAGPYVAGYE